MKSNVDLEAYFERIEYNGTAEATSEVLKTLHRLHPGAIAFESLNPFLGIPVQLDTQSLRHKMIHQKRGGYCFEQNLLFKSVLEALGFEVKGLAARILWNRSESEVAPRGHMLLHVEIKGKSYIADVGFGGNTLTAPLELKEDVIQQTPHEPARLIRLNQREYRLEFELQGKWKPLYKFKTEEQFLPEYEITNWYLSNHPESHFVTGLIAARSDEGRRLVLKNNRFSIHHLDGETEKHTLTTTAEIKEILKNEFRINLPAVTTLNEKLEQLVKQEVVPGS